MLAIAPSTDTRAERHRATHERILDAAWRLARVNGLAGISLRELAASVGMRAPSLYTYFPSKNHLYDAMYAQGLRGIVGAMREVPRRKDPAERVRRLARTFVRLCCEDPYRYELIFQRPIPGFVPSPESFAIGIAGLGAMRDALEAAGARGERTLDTYRGLINGLIGMQIANDPGGDRWKRLTDDAINMFLQYHAVQRSRGNGRKP